MAVVVPIQPYLQGVAIGLVEPGFANFLARYYSGGPWPAGAFDGWQFGVTWNHLWYLPYLWVYTSLLLALLPLLESPLGERLRERFAGLRGSALVLLPALLPIAYALLLERRFPPTHDLFHDAYLHALYFTLFLYGYWIGTDRGLWAEAARLRHRALALALALFAANAVLGGSAILRNLYLWSAILAVLGYAHAHLNRPFRWLEWANESVYPWYVLHQSLIVALAFALAPLALGPVLEPALLVAGTLAGCWLINDVLVRRTRWLRPLFGLKRGLKRGARDWQLNLLRWG